jgi:2-oxoglutarate ferredoxin oxidoreductase subunit alpha
MNVNDFMIKIATVNGSGSQTANQILMECFFLMNIPVGSKNYFPSNIQGMPTWFTVRVHSRGFIGAKERCDLLVNCNVKTLPEDLQSLHPKGLLFYDSETTLPASSPDLQGRAFPIPFKTLLDEAEIPVRYRKPTGNIVYVGVLSAYLEIPEEILLQTLQKHFGKKENILELNKKAALLGRKYFSQNDGRVPKLFQARTLSRQGQKVLMDGNTASAMGLLYGGCSFVSWYPITPSTSVIESYKDLVKKYRTLNTETSPRQVIMQAEDELSAICMVLGAGWAGARALTATSGPGLSLMAEAAGYAYYAEIPSVIWNVQRSGPSTGLPTRTSQGDLLSAHLLSHGDTKHVCLLPGTLSECFEFGQTCFDLAERLQTLVIVLSDLDLGMNLWVEDRWPYPTRPYDRGKIINLEKLQGGFKFERYQDLDNDGIPARTLPGTPHEQAAYFTRGSGHTTTAVYTENPEAYQEVLDRLTKKWNTARTLVPPPIIKNNQSSQGIIYHGALDSVVAEMQDEIQSIVRLNTCRIRALPFSQEIRNFLEQNDQIFVVDQNRDGQMFQLLAMEYPELAAKLVSLRYYNGLPVNAEKLRKDFTHAAHLSL